MYNEEIILAFTDFVKTYLNKSGFRSSVPSRPIRLYLRCYLDFFFQVFLEKWPESGVWRRHRSLIDGHGTSLFLANIGTRSVRVARFIIIFFSIFLKKANDKESFHFDSFAWGTENFLSLEKGVYLNYMLDFGGKNWKIKMNFKYFLRFLFLVIFTNWFF